VVERDRVATGPEVDRHLSALDLRAGTSAIVAQINRIGCCPLTSFSVDQDDDIRWPVNPDLLLDRMSPEGGTELLERNLPINAAAVAHTGDGDLLLVTPSGIVRLRDQRRYPRRASRRVRHEPAFLTPSRWEGAEMPVSADSLSDEGPSRERAAMAGRSAPAAGRW
jgi:hypothetical protein